MPLLRQTWTLVVKNLLIALVRHPISTPFRAFVLPVVFIVFLSYAKSLFIPASVYGISEPHDVRSLSEAISAVGGGRNKLVFVNNGYEGGEIDAIISNVTAPIESTDIHILKIQQEVDLLTECRNTILGTSTCIAAAVFYSSPSEGAGGIWNYSLRADGALQTKILTDSNNNDAQIYVLPLQHAIDSAISQSGTSGGHPLPSIVQNYPYTSLTAAQRRTQIRTRYMGGIIDILGIAFYIGMVGVSYQLTGLIAQEREIGMAQLLDSMMPNRARWQPQAIRILANHLAFDLIYLPGWIVMSIVLCAGVFTQTNPAIILFTNIFAGLSTSSLSVFGAGFFRKAQLSGISTVIIFLLLAVLAQVVNKAGTASVAVLSLLFPPMNYTFLIITIARWERQDLGTNLVKSAPEHTSTLPAIVFWVFSIIQIVVYPILGAWVERLLYGTASKARKTATDGSDAAVTLTGFTKVYEPRWMQRLAQFVLRRPVKKVHAVNNLNFCARRGEIMVYLGANGSGKSTTLDAIAGLTEITAGEIQIDFSENNTSLGVCPQKNVLWQHLTVYEHVRIFNKIKSDSGVASKDEILELLKACDIDFKYKAKSRTLSGGQKRKLQLAMMFTGGSTVCLVDEVSSGLDPLSRRKIWDILLSERGRRSIILTTHFLDEADLLADHIAILSKGHLRAYGTSVQLKHDMGNGYRVHVFHREGEKSVHIYDKPHVAQDDQVMYLMSSSQEAARFISRLESDGLMEYQVSGPTIEDVFLKLADEAKPESDEDIKETRVNTTSRSSSPADEEKKGEHVVTMAASGPSAVPELLTGKRIGMWHQAAVLFWKRMVVIRRNPLPSIAAFLIPVVAAGLTTLFLPNYELPGCSPISIVSISDIYTLSSDYTYQLVGGPPSLLTQQAVQAYADTLPGSDGNSTGNLTQLYNSMILVESLDDFNREIDTRFANITPGGFFLGSNGQAPTFAWQGNTDISGAQIVQNLLDTLLSNIPIASRYQAFDVPWPVDAGQALQMITYFGLAMAVYPSFFALYPTLERLRNVRQLYYSNGVRAMPLWLAYTSFDFVLVLAISACATIIFAAVTSIWYHIGYLFVVFFLYGLASTLLSYVISLFSKSQLAAFAFAAAGQAVIFLLYFIAFMSILTYVGAAEQHHIINIAHFTIAIISPIANLTRALFISLNVFALTCHGEELASYPGDLTVYGGPILYLIMQSLILFCVLIWWESGSLWRRLRRKKQPEEVEINSTSDADVSNELTRVTSSRDGLRVLRLTKQFKKNLAVDDVTFGVPLGEVFALLGPNGAGKSTVISLVRGDLQPSRRGGDIFVEDVSVISHRAQARSRLGVCPQFDAMDTMTVAEHLHFYARIRGVSNPKHNAVAVMQAVGLTAYSERMAAKLSGGNKRKLSLGIALMGNPSVLLLDEPSSGMDAASKRVMWRTLASVVPGRSLVLTTHSMEEADALANRAGIMASKMLALGTTDYLRRKHGDSYYVHLVHSQSPHTSDEDMEKIRDWIRAQFPNATIEDKTYHGQVRFSVPVSSSPAQQTSDLKSMTNIAVEKVYSDDMDDSQITTIDEKAPNVALSKSISTSKTTISSLFAALEIAKSELGIEYYNLSRATLDQVFLSIINKHNVLEDRGHAE